MKIKRFVIFGAILALFAVSFASALDIEVEKTAKVPTIISELDNPAIFYFIITNNGAPDKVEIYSLVGTRFEPSGIFNLSSGKTTRTLEVYPSSSARSRGGDYAFEYQIKGIGDDLFKDKLSIKIVKLKDVFEITPKDITYGDKKATITLTNMQNMDIEDATIWIESEFYDYENELSFGPFESKTISLTIDSSGIKSLDAGHYVVKLTSQIEDVRATIEKSVNYVESQNILNEQSSDGFIIRKTAITRTNNGNLEVPDKIEVTKNVFTRLFTTTDSEPISTERKGAIVTYRWERDLKPGASWTVEVTTNYTLPFILILLIAAACIFVYVYSKTAVVLTKRCSYVRTTNGQFALKVMLHLKARKSVDSIMVYDHIPRAMKIYEKAGMPHKFDEHTGKLSWKVERLNAGEERIFSYIVYSPIRVVGRLELSPAVVHFNKDGQSQFVASNRTFFMSEIHPRF